MITRRHVVAAGIGVVTGLLSYAIQLRPLYALYFDHPAGDFYWCLRAASDLLAGHDVYGYPATMYAIPYPLPAAFAGLPFVWMPWDIAAAVFFAVSSALMAYSLTADGKWWRLLAFLSFPYFQAVSATQWSPIILAASNIGWLLPVIAVKPTIAMAAVVTKKPTRSGMALVAITLLVSVLAYPGWITTWLSQTGQYNGFVPLLTPLGPILLLSLLRWRDSRTRTFLAMCVVPQQRYGYDQLLLWLIPSTKREMLAITLVSWMAYPISEYFGYQYAHWTLMVFLYIPALVALTRHPTSCGV